MKLVSRFVPACAVALTLAMVSGCLVAPVVPPLGFVYSGVSAPLDSDVQDTKLGSREGRSSSTSILGIVSWGDASTRAAADEGGITTVSHADYEYTNFLGIYQSYTTIVHGE